MNMDLDPLHYVRSPIHCFVLLWGAITGTEEWILLSSSSHLESGLFLFYWWP